jgi:cytochrome P450
MLMFILGVLHSPEVLKGAQEEIDCVVGCERLQIFEDCDNLPYIAAVIKETLCWELVIPLGVPHCLTQDNVSPYPLITTFFNYFPGLQRILHSQGHCHNS